MIPAARIPALDEDHPGPAISVAARYILSDVIPPPGYRPSIERVQEAVVNHYGLTVARLTSASREHKFALPREAFRQRQDGAKRAAAPKAGWEALG